MKISKKNLLFVLFPLFMYSCSDDFSDSEYSESENNLSLRSGGGSLTLSFGGSCVVMGTKVDPDISYSVPNSSGQVFLYCRVGNNPDINIDSDGIHSPGEQTFRTYTSSLSSAHNEFFNVPGEWRYQALAVIGGDIYLSNIVEIEVSFPYQADIVNDWSVQYAMDDLWTKTLDAASDNGRKEKGFWIYAYVNTNGLAFEIGDREDGPLVTGCEGTAASISPSIPSTTPPVDPYGENAKYPVAYFHTHTTLHYCTGERNTGFSLGDDTWNSNNDALLLLYDYSASTIYGGQDLYESYKLYPEGNSDGRRSTPHHWIGSN